MSLLHNDCWVWLKKLYWLCHIGKILINHNRRVGGVAWCDFSPLELSKLIKFRFPVGQCITTIAVKINIMDAKTTVRDTENPVTWNEQANTRQISLLPLTKWGVFHEYDEHAWNMLLFKAVSSSTKVQKTELSSQCSTLFEEHSHKAELSQLSINKSWYIYIYIYI